jgi:hypothetical protein
VHTSKPVLNIAFVYDDERLLFKQTYLRRRSTSWGQSFNDFVIFCIQVTEYLLDHQWIFIRHIAISKTSGSIHCANRLSCFGFLLTLASCNNV